jgi:hypothetical protein
MGQGLDTFVGRLDHPSASEANSTSFYSNKTSAISNNLSNSRYLLHRRDNNLKFLNQNQQGDGASVGKIVPGGPPGGVLTQSIDNGMSGQGTIGAAGYGSRTSNFSSNVGVPNGAIYNNINKPANYRASFYS